MLVVASSIAVNGVGALHAGALVAVKKEGCSTLTGLPFLGEAARRRMLCLRGDEGVVQLVARGRSSVGSRVRDGTALVVGGGRGGRVRSGVGVRVAAVRVVVSLCLRLRLRLRP